MANRFERSRKQRAAMLESEARPEPDAAETIDLVRRTLDENGANGLPGRSRTRIRNALKKLNIGASSRGAKRCGGPDGRSDTAPPSGPRQRPDRLYLALAVFAAIFFVPPLVFGIVLFLAAAVLVTLYYAIGHDRVVGMAIAYHARIETRDPKRAQMLRHRAARLSAGAGRIAACLPERWTQGLYLPDFEPETERPEKMQSDPFERLSMQVKA